MSKTLTKTAEKDAADRFVLLQAMRIVTEITMECTASASPQVRTVYPSPSALDRAIAARVVQLLT